MCRVTNLLSKKKTGYKVLAMRGDKFYSTFTGQEMKTGKVSLPPKKANPIYYGWVISSRRIFVDQILYKPNYIGLSSAFVRKEDAEELYDSHLKRKKRGYKIVLAKVTFKNDTFVGNYYNVADVITGNTIRSIEIIK